ncbi:MULTISPECIES: glycosyltransferase family 2 protein [unclassified Lentimicrobium]|uniref:glycosyltransferase family 2 protein n=1 Tax=unclassified Lentimicrobium TaxID=2677434 RepID=UPI001553A2B1|nr:MULTISPECIES: glycosyltransferase family 2 protein [unclassified Lentimicrobium]NPD46534.1 glycosyltransferase family 2 protein [Lentimicrobium sp. S6]NPD85183.1 glycosyltransferase family 2 protein [Lentimicrobium sp. L6]
MLKVAVVILNWNGKSFLQKFLPSVLKNIPYYAELFVADNHSSDDSVEFLKENYPQVHLVINSENGGYAKGYNEGLKQIDAQYYVLLNSDIEVGPNWIEPIVQLMDGDAQIAACQPKILSFHQKQEFEYAGAGGGYIDKYGYPFCRGRIFQEIEEDHQQFDDSIEVFWASGACMFVRAEHYHELGGLDDDFFAHMEEIDFCWRAKNAGYKIFYEGKSVVYHVGGGTLHKSNPKKTYLNFRNNFYLLYKNLEGKRLIPVFFWRLVLDGVAGIKFFIDGDYKDTYAILKAHLKFYCSLPSLYQKRRDLNQNRVSMMYQRNIVYEHFVKKIKKFNSLQKDRFS